MSPLELLFVVLLLIVILNGAPITFGVLILLVIVGGFITFNKKKFSGNRKS